MSKLVDGFFVESRATGYSGWGGYGLVKEGFVYVFVGWSYIVLKVLEVELMEELRCEVLV